MALKWSMAARKSRTDGYDHSINDLSEVGSPDAWKLGTRNQGLTSILSTWQMWGTATTRRVVNHSLVNEMAAANWTLSWWGAQYQSILDLLSLGDDYDPLAWLAAYQSFHHWSQDENGEYLSVCALPWFPPVAESGFLFWSGSCPAMIRQSRIREERERRPFAPMWVS